MLPDLIVVSTPQMLKNLSIEADEAGMFKRINANLYRLGYFPLYSFQKLALLNFTSFSFVDLSLKTSINSKTSFLKDAHSDLIDSKSLVCKNRLFCIIEASSSDSESESENKRSSLSFGFETAFIYENIFYLKSSQKIKKKI